MDSDQGNGRRSVRVAPSVAAGEGFVPLEVMARRLGRDPEDLLRLDGDENPYGCSLRVLEVLGSAQHLHMPGDPLARDVRVPLEAYTGVSRERLTVAGPFYELLDRVLRAVTTPGQSILIPTPAREVYAAVAERLGLTVVGLPLGRDFHLSREELQRVAAENSVAAILLTSPHEPTGMTIEPTDVVELLHAGWQVIVDESLFEFAPRTVAPLGSEFDNLIVLRDCSIWAGLSGVPVSYAIASRKLTRELGASATIGGVPAGPSRAAQLALTASLDDSEALLSQVKNLRVERARMFRQLRKLNLLQPYQSEANFLLCVMSRGNALTVRDRLAREFGILVRAIQTPELRNHLRITVGRSEDTDRLMSALLKIAERV